MNPEIQLRMSRTMKLSFHPVVDNPVRMAYVAGWRNANDLLDRLGDLECAVGETAVVPARWEPFYDECPCCRGAYGFAWARRQLESPHEFAVALSLFPGEEPQLSARISEANRLILRAEREGSHITRKLMLAEALGAWKSHDAGWLEQIVSQCAALGIVTTVDFLREQVLHALKPLELLVANEEPSGPVLEGEAGSRAGYGFEKKLMQMDGWTPDFGRIILPVDARTHALKREILVIDLHMVVLLRGRRAVRTVAWENVTLVHLFEDALTFEVAAEPPLVVAGYQDPQAVLETVQACYRAATERILQTLASKVTHASP
jgi:hypothetical protein